VEETVRAAFIREFGKMPKAYIKVMNAWLGIGKLVQDPASWFRDLALCFEDMLRVFWTKPLNIKFKTKVEVKTEPHGMPNLTMSNSEEPSTMHELLIHGGEGVEMTSTSLSVGNMQMFDVAMKANIEWLDIFCAATKIYLEFEHELLWITPKCKKENSVLGSTSRFLVESLYGDFGNAMFAQVGPNLLKSVVEKWLAPITHVLVCNYGLPVPRLDQRSPEVQRCVFKESVVHETVYTRKLAGML
jgi:hypothetical protein